MKCKTWELAYRRLRVAAKWQRVFGSHRRLRAGTRLTHCMKAAVGLLESGTAGMHPYPPLTNVTLPDADSWS
jgi:hypothetical protein